MHVIRYSKIRWNVTYHCLYKAVVLNLVGGTKRHKFHNAFHKPLVLENMHCVLFSSNYKYMYTIIYCISAQTSQVGHDITNNTSGVNQTILNPKPTHRTLGARWNPGYEPLV